MKSKLKVNAGFFNCSLLITAICSLFFLGGCSYDTTSILPTYIKKINIEPFTNKSFRPDINDKLMSSAIKEFIADGRLTVSSKQDADAVLYGEIKQYSLESFSYTEKINAEEYKVRIVINIWLKDVKQDAILWHEDNIEAWTTASSVTKGGLEITVENEAINEVIEKLSRKIVKRTIDGWTNI